MLLNCGGGEDLRVCWTTKRSNQPILKEINPEYLVEGLILKFQYSGHMIQRNSDGASTGARPCTEMLGFRQYL